MFENIIEYKALHEACAEAFAFGDATFKRDFGPWKRGQKVDYLWFNLEKGTVTEYNENNEIVFESKFELSPM